MSKDPAFLWYDGDAARDVSHMNRLERGCYFDLVQFQRKNHGFTVDQVRKIIGKDFESCWNALELILSKDEDGLFFIEWVRESINKRKQHSDIQRDRIKKYWNSRKNHGNSVELPLENENENVIESEIEVVVQKEVKKVFVPPTVEEVAAYCLERKNGINASRFVNHYEARGWMLGKNKMKSWQAAIRTWEGNDVPDSGKIGTNQAQLRPGAGRANQQRPGYDANGNALGAAARPGEFDEGILTLEGVPDHR